MPALYPITEEKYQHLISGRSIKIKHTDYKIGENGEMIPIESKRVCTGSRKDIERF